MTDAHAWYAMILFLKRHIDTGWTIERLSTLRTTSDSNRRTERRRHFLQENGKSGFECVDEVLRMEAAD